MPTECVNPNITLIKYSGPVDNNVCKRDCGRLPGGRLAVHQNQDQYHCITMAGKGRSDYDKRPPIWTGIRVRSEGGLFNPLTNENVPVFDATISWFSNLSPYKTLLSGASEKKSENCIVISAGIFVETKCTSRFAKTCACSQGKRLPTTGIDPRVLSCS